MYVRTDGRKEIHPCVLQDIGPLGPLPKKDDENTGNGVWKIVGVRGKKKLVYISV